MMRSLLYVPGNRSDFLSTAGSRGADAVIIDLEDAVPEAEKDNARLGLQDWVPAIGSNGTQVLVRINSEAERLLDDALAACLAGANALCIPKVNRVSTLRDLEEALAGTERKMNRPPMRFLPLIEDAQGLFEARWIAAASRVFGVCCGGEDLALSMSAEPAADVLRIPHLLVHYAAKAAGVLSFGILRSIVEFTDLAAMQLAADEARRFGFDGACCIHPSVVPILNAAFSSNEEGLEWARKVVNADKIESRNGRGAFMLDGRFVDAPVIKRARSLLKKAEGQLKN